MPSPQLFRKKRELWKQVLHERHGELISVERCWWLVEYGIQFSRDECSFERECVFWVEWLHSRAEGVVAEWWVATKQEGQLPARLKMVLNFQLRYLDLSVESDVRNREVV